MWWPAGVACGGACWQRMAGDGRAWRGGRTATAAEDRGCRGGRSLWGAAGGGCWRGMTAGDGAHGWQRRLMLVGAANGVSRRRGWLAAGLVRRGDCRRRRLRLAAVAGGGGPRPVPTRPRRALVPFLSSFSVVAACACGGVLLASCSCRYPYACRCSVVARLRAPDSPRCSGWRSRCWRPQSAGRWLSAVAEAVGSDGQG